MIYPPLVDNVFRATVFLLDDTQLVHETFLEDVNGILNTGEVPSLFNNEELVAINEALTKPAQVRYDKVQVDELLLNCSR